MLCYSRVQPSLLGEEGGPDSRELRKSSLAPPPKALYSPVSIALGEWSGSTPDSSFFASHYLKEKFTPKKPVFFPNTH